MRTVTAEQPSTFRAPSADLVALKYADYVFQAKFTQRLVNRHPSKRPSASELLSSELILDKDKVRSWVSVCAWCVHFEGKLANGQYNRLLSVYF